MIEIASNSNIRDCFKYFKSSNPSLKNEEVNEQRIDEWIPSMTENIDNLMWKDCENEMVHI